MARGGSKAGQVGIACGFLSGEAAAVRGRGLGYGSRTARAPVLGPAPQAGHAD
jgi:hypothetical protein